MTIRLAPNVDLLFTEAGDVPQRIAAAADAGFDAVEFWTTSDRDVPQIARVASDRGVAITSILAEPRTNITFPDTDLGSFYDGVAATVDRARQLDCDRIVVSGGTGYLRRSRREQLELLVEVYGELVARTEGSGVTFTLEAFNTKVDHPGALLDNTADAVSVVRQVGSERFAVLYDLYHSMAQGEDPAAVFAESGDVIRALQLADVPGRGEPGSGHVDWPSLVALVVSTGYDGIIGLEFYPTRKTVEAIEYIRAVVSRGGH
ncbi:TIM barrel protein [Mycobacterium sp. NPDC003449]